jgi:hypothetical protein
MALFASLPVFLVLAVAISPPDQLKDSYGPDGAPSDGPVKENRECPNMNRAFCSVPQVSKGSVKNQ